MTNAARQSQTPQATSTDVVTLSVPAHPSYVSVLRTVTASMAARRDFTIEEIDDLRIAVDEASALLLAQDESDAATQAAPAPSPSQDAELALVAEFGGSDGVLSVTVSVPSATSTAHTSPLDQNSFAWMVLTALADDVTAHDANGQRSISLTKNRLPRS